MSDLIDRQAAIDAIFRTCRRTCALSHALEKVFEKLPSAQPEIIRCKNCTRFDKKKGCNLVEGLNIAKADSFCSYGERREDEQADV